MVKDVQIMGIINVNDDSFFARSRVGSNGAFIKRMDQVIAEGADIVDLGGCSTRPGSVSVSEEVEWKRLEPVLKICREKYGRVHISIDTFRSGIVRRAYDLIGPFMVNDISAGEDDPEMLDTVAGLGLEYIAMHKRGNPATMQSLCRYDDVTEDLIAYFRDFDRKASEAGIKDWILDPGFGFAKTFGQNYELLERLSRFKCLGRKILVGISRKGFLYKPLGLTPEEALPMTTRYHKVAIENGADILRVHDVAQAKKLLYD